MKRTLNLNKTKLWCVNLLSISEKLDSDGNPTGDFIKTYSTPSIIYLALYPAIGTVKEQVFGKDVSLDMMAVSNNIVLNKDTLLFLTEPLSNYFTTYDYRVDNIKSSLNTTQYGLTRRT